MIRSVASRSKKRADKKQKINSESTEKSDNKTIFKSSKLVLNMIINATKIANFS